MDYHLKLLELMDEEQLTHKAVIEELLSYLSSDEIKKFCQEGFGGEINDLFTEEEEEEEEVDSDYYRWFEGSDVTPSSLEDDAEIVGER